MGAGNICLFCVTFNLISDTDTEITQVLNN